MAGAADLGRLLIGLGPRRGALRAAHAALRVQAAGEDGVIRWWAGGR